MTQTATVKPPAAAARRTREEEPTNIKETIDSILVAFILAFVFRAFVVEAFVIPTGSMAPTLLGAHMRFDCPDCGYHFTVNYSGVQEGDDVIVPSVNYVLVKENGQVVPKPRVLHLICPNCGYKLPKIDQSNPINDATGPPVYYGDRILVLKYLYLFQDPRQWDVVVFKSPTDPERFDYRQNFIKRLIGRPGESIMILDGDIYVATKDPSMGPLSAADFTVQTKPRHAQDALWRIVHDNDYQPTGKSRLSQRAYEEPWKTDTGNGWDLAAGGGPGPVARRVFRFKSELGGGNVWFDPKANAQKFPLTDWLAYDMSVIMGPHSREVDQYGAPLLANRENVSDLKLDLHYQREAGDGPLKLRLTKLGDAFTAELLPNQVVLYQASGAGAPVEIGRRRIDLGNKIVHVEFQNVDYQVTLYIDGEEVIRTTGYKPNIPALIDAFTSGRPQPLPEISIAAERQACTVSHLSLWRDVYYLNVDQSGTPQRWASPHQFPGGVITLGKGEFFVCGDNSLLSGDARGWYEPIRLDDEFLNVDAGRVPERFLLGKAFFVYWPAGYRPTPGMPGLVPNFGQMRFIH